MAAITHVFTIAHVPKMLDEDEELLHEISIKMEPEDGVMHVYRIGDDGITTFSDFGVEDLRKLLQIHKENAVREQATPANKPPERS